MSVHTTRATVIAHLASAALLFSVEPLPLPSEPSALESPLLDQYRAELARIERGSRTFAKRTGATIPADFSPWWIRGQRNTLGDSSRSQGISVDGLYLRAIQHSNQIQVFSDLPLIRETGIQEASGAFDTNAFLQGKFDRTNDPVGNTLTTGGAAASSRTSGRFEAGVKEEIHHRHRGHGLAKPRPHRQQLRSTSSPIRSRRRPSRSPCRAAAAQRRGRFLQPLASCTSPGSIPRSR